jgi:Fic family protein
MVYRITYNKARPYLEFETMSKVIKRHWSSNIGSGMSRKDRLSCDYEAYVPDALTGRGIALDGDVAADVVDAEVAITRLNVEASALIETEALARILLRAESVASSRIEGLEVGAGRLLRAEATRELGGYVKDITASEVLANIDAMRFALDEFDPGEKIALERLLEVHRRLLRGTWLQEHAGVVRTEQNWIGGSGHNPCSAAFVPPPPEHVPSLLEDLCAFCNEDSLPAVAQAAIAHAQFETIHPFVDGNGRTGRALIHLVLRRRGLATRVLVPVSLVLATWARDYIDGLTTFRYRGPASARAAHEGINLWVARFAGACTRAVQDAVTFERRISLIQESWRERLGSVREGSALDLLVRALPGAPLFTATGAAALVDRSFVAANEAIARLLDAGVIRQVNMGARNRAFEAREVVAAFTALERRLASPAGDTRLSPPVRKTPARP